LRGTKRISFEKPGNTNLLTKCHISNILNAQALFYSKGS
jgi:hypothetical protein